MKKPFTAVILAGGKSSRMGTDKSQLIYKDSTFIRIQGEKLKSAGASQLLISSDYCALLGWESVKDIYKDKGPMGGIYSAMKHSVYENCLVVSVDAIGVTREIIDGLIKTHEKERNNITLLRHGGSTGEQIVEPLIAVYDTSLLPYFDECVKSDKLKLTRLIDDLEKDGACKVGCYSIENRIISNCNTRKDYEEIVGM